MSISLNSFSANVKAESDKVNTNFINISSAIRPCYALAVDEILTVGTGKTLTIPIVHTSLTLNKVFATVKTAPTGTTSTPISGKSLVLDINKNGTSIWASNTGNRLSIADGATTGTQTAFDTATFAEGDNVTLDIDFVGSTTNGESLLVVLRFEHN